MIYKITEEELEKTSDILDFLAKQFTTSPTIGTIFASPLDDENWLPCDGRVVLLDDYPEFYEVIKKYFHKDTHCFYKETHLVGEKVVFRDVFKIPDLRDSQGVIGYIKVR